MSTNITAPDFWALWITDAFKALQEAQGAARSAVAALTLLAWDIVTTLDDEVTLIWLSGWTLPKALYVFLRYYALFILIVHNFRALVPCVPWLIFELVSIFVVEAAVEVIIILRIYAVYAAQHKIMYIMLIGFAVEVIIMAVTLGMSIPKVTSGFYCNAADLPAEMVLYSTASIVYETFLFGLMMVGVIGGAMDGFADTTLVRVLVRDGMFAYIGLYLAMLLNTLLFTLAPTTLVTLGFPWLLAIIGVAGSRLVLNLRAKHANNISIPPSLADIRFTVPSRIYPAVSIDDPENVYLREDDASSDDDEQSYHECSALNPISRSHSMNSRAMGMRASSESQTSPLSSNILLPSR